MFRINPVYKDNVEADERRTHHFEVRGKTDKVAGKLVSGYTVLYDGERYHAWSIDAAPYPFPHGSTQRCVAFGLVQALQICDEAKIPPSDNVVLHIRHKPVFNALEKGYDVRKNSCRGHYHNIEIKSGRRRVFLALDNGRKHR